MELLIFPVIVVVATLWLLYRFLTRPTPPPRPPHHRSGNGGGLGILITTGVNLSLTPVLVIGALLVALLALLIDWVGRVVEHVARPKGL